MKALNYLNTCEVNESDKAYLESIAKDDPAKFQPWKGVHIRKGLLSLMHLLML